MDSRTKKTNVLLLCLAIFSTAYAQSIFVSFGPVFTSTKQVVPIVNGKKYYSNTDYMFAISYEHFLNNHISLMGSFCKFDGYTFIFFEKGGFISYGNEIGGTGFTGVKVSRSDIGITYRLTNVKKRFYLSPFVAMGMQISRKTGVEIYSTLISINGPNYFELEPISADPFNTIQVVPSLGFRTGFVLWKRFDIGLSFQGVYAFKPYQRMYLKYQYKGVVQPTGEFEATGTGLFVTLGVGYRFAKFIK